MKKCCIVEQGGDNSCQKLFKSYFERIFHLQNLSGLSNLWQLKSAFLILVYGVLQPVTKNSSAEAAVLRTSEEPTWSWHCWECVHCDMPQPHGGCRAASTSNLLLLSLEIKTKTGSAAGGEAGGLISAPLWPRHETARGFSSLFWVEEIRKVHVWHHEDVSAQNSKQNSLEILVHIPLASCMSVATATNSSLWAGLICFPSAVYNPFLAQPNLPRYHCVLGMGVVDENWARHHMWRANYSDPKTVNIHENGKIRMNRAQGSIFSYQTYNLHWSEGEAE